MSEIEFCTLYVVAERWILGCILRFMHAKNHFSDTLIPIHQSEPSIAGPSGGQTACSLGQQRVRYTLPNRRVNMKLLLLMLALTVTGFAETHRFEPTDFYNTFSGAHKPVLRIKPGDHVVTFTIDSHGVGPIR